MVLPIRRRGSGSGGVLRALHPLKDFDKTREQMGRFLEQAAATPRGGGAWLPMAEEEKSDTSYTLKIELPGYPAEDIDIEVEGDELIIRGELSRQHRDNVLTRRKGGFTYRTALPSGADRERCDAHLDDGVLTVTVPRATQLHRRKIEIGRRPSTPEGSTPGVRADKSDVMTPVEAHNTFVAGAAAAASGTRPSGETTEGAPGGAQPGAGV
ncbi:Hsp20/alpha crystallin family protein [Streptomyces sp. NPDC059851]|uniref:Hsp20/alpha crystallin family protein n=1 Tax=Streptomyces sp. NPDC059851 TaxID=3346971 RepID=UPI003668AA83